MSKNREKTLMNQLPSAAKFKTLTGYFCIKLSGKQPALKGAPLNANACDLTSGELRYIELQQEVIPL